MLPIDRQDHHRDYPNHGYQDNTSCLYIGQSDQSAFGLFEYSFQEGDPSNTVPSLNCTFQMNSTFWMTHDNK
jgi:hypothetical protein